MKLQLKTDINNAIAILISTGALPHINLPEIQINRTKDKSHGDLSSNIALVLAKPAKMAPKQIAQLLVSQLASSGAISKVEIAGPGFINFTLSTQTQLQTVLTILDMRERYGLSQIGQGKTVHIEYVSANPTGPLHVGHGRGAAYGSVVSALLTAVGYQVHREYYVNDAGRQMDILTVSVWLRYLALCSETVVFPSNGYQGDYIVEIAQHLKQCHDTKYHSPIETVIEGISPDAPTGDKEQHIDQLIDRAKAILNNDYETVFKAGIHHILSEIREDLTAFGTEYDDWFSERHLIASRMVSTAIEKLKQANMLYQQSGAWWFKSTAFGDEKDRVVIRDNGQMTYFASDIGYHLHKYQQGFDKIIDIWGADHHGYIARVAAAIAALDQNKDKLTVLLVQFAVLYRGKEKVAMSTRSGQFVTLRQLQQEVGKDAARFFYVMRGADQHMDFDLELAKSQSNDNPVYYVQYAHARIASVIKQSQQRQRAIDVSLGKQHLEKLNTSHEQTILSTLSRYPEVVEKAAINYTPHILAHYLLDLSREFHTYYNAYPFIIDDEALSQARLTFIKAIQQVLRNGLTLLGVSAPESM